MSRHPLRCLFNSSSIQASMDQCYLFPKCSFCQESINGRGRKYQICCLSGKIRPNCVLLAGLGFISPAQLNLYASLDVFDAASKDRPIVDMELPLRVSRFNRQVVLSCLAHESWNEYLLFVLLQVCFNLLPDVAC